MINKCIKYLTLVTLVYWGFSYREVAAAFDVVILQDTKRAVRVIPERSSGLDLYLMAYTLETGADVRVTEVMNTADCRLYSYSNLGGGFAKEMDFKREEKSIIFKIEEHSSGYILEADGKRFCFWIEDYSIHRFNVKSISPGQSNCESTVISFRGNASAIYYYSIDGRKLELSREILLNYNNLSWNSETSSWVLEEKQDQLASLKEEITLYLAIFCSTTIKITGDRFLKAWGEEISVESGMIAATGLNAHCFVRRLNPEGEITNSGEGLSGGAPAEMSFIAIPTDAIVHSEWQQSRSENFEEIEARYQQVELLITLNETGSYFFRYVGSNADGSCEFIGETYVVGIGASVLRIPNAFSPNGDGINDIWRVSSSSIISFRCTIFDRYGEEIYSFNDPSGGWNGERKGKIVGSGVYYYVIDALGADGVNYHKAGDINILGSNSSAKKGIANEVKGL